MSRSVSIVTPENVKIDYELAGLASRAGAVIIDTLFQILGFLVILLAMFVLGVVGGSAGAQWALTALIISGFIIFWGYFIFFETIWNGQTPGKRLLRLRTVREGGMPVDLSCAAVRNLIRVVDLLPLLPSPYMVAGISALVTRDNKRLGDFAAGTLVVKERVEWANDLRAAPAPVSPLRSARVPYAESAYVKNIELITLDEFEAAKRFVERRIELQPHVAEQLATEIAKPLMDRLGIEDRPMVYGNLLSEIYFKCMEERGMR